MHSLFREDILSNNIEFKSIFDSLMKEEKIRDFSDSFWDFIRRDKTPIKVNNEPLAFIDLFHQNVTDGKCELCSMELVMLLDKFGVYSEAVKCINTNFAGTKGSSYGGHWYVFIPSKALAIDTSLFILGSEEAFKELGHIVVRKYDIDTIFKEKPELFDRYESMIINKNNLK